MQPLLMELTIEGADGPTTVLRPTGDEQWGTTTRCQRVDGKLNCDVHLGRAEETQCLNSFPEATPGITHTVAVRVFDMAGNSSASTADEHFEFQAFENAWDNYCGTGCVNGCTMVRGPATGNAALAFFAALGLVGLAVIRKRLNAEAQLQKNAL